MVFTQIEFVIFFVALLLLVFIFRKLEWRKNILLLASYYFYAYWDWRFLILLVFCSVFNYFCGVGIKRTESPAAQKRWIFLSVAGSLAVLGFFKYYNFFVESLSALCGCKLGTLKIILPVGISFYTFQCLSFSIDVYRKKLKHFPSLRDFSLYVAFFPQLVAGPIVRAADFLPQLERNTRFTPQTMAKGFEQFVFGFFKKVFIADRLAVFVDVIFSNSGAYDGGTLALALLAYAIQILCDFSGYSDMAIGLARILGYRFNVNFDTPYISLSITEFWRRWHISLSSWLKDYLYISLGGNRKGKARTYANLIITMVLGGLWHGASWNFVFWGTWHGIWLAIHKVFMQFRRIPSKAFLRSCYLFLSWLVTMLIVLVGWVFFRNDTFAKSITYLTRLFGWAEGVSWYEPFVVGVVAATGIHNWLIAKGRLRRVRMPRLGSVYYWWLLLSMLLLAIIFQPTEFQPFIYFQF